MNRDASVLRKGSSVKAYSLPLSVKTVEERAFFDQRTLESVRLNENLTKLGSRCFAQTEIRRVVAPPGLKSIKFETFMGCASLKFVDFRAAKTLKRLEEHAFCGCIGLEHVLLGTGLETIENSCFKECGLRTLDVPGSVRTIGGCAFDSCAGLARVSFAGGGPEVLGPRAFASSGLISFTAPVSLRRVGKCAFSGCLRLKRADFGLCAL